MMNGKSKLGPLGQRLLGAFALVALASVLFVTIAALIGSERGLAASAGTERERAATEIADLVGRQYAQAGEWATVDLNPAIAAAEAVEARLRVVDAVGSVVGGTQHGGMGMGRGGTEAPVTVDGLLVGSIRLAFGQSAADRGRQVAWAWIIGAAIAAVALALVAGWIMSRRVSRPIQQLTRAAQAFASGDRTIDVDTNAVGEIGELAHAFDAAANAIAQEERARRNLSADVAHELRTPLAALLAGLEEARDGLVTADTAALTRLHDQAIRLGRIVDDLSALSMAEAPTALTRRELIDLSEVVRSAVDVHGAGVQAAGIAVVTDIEDDLRIQADGERIDQILANLLANAARYCRSGDSVTIRVHGAGQACVIEVADSGPGIPPASLPHVFDRFWRGPTAIPGSGIGLAVVKALVEAHGGSVAVASDGAHGTTFRIVLPSA